MAETDWVVARGEQRFAAPNLSTVQEWARSGKVLAEDQVWSPVSNEWRSALDMSDVSPFIVRRTAPVVPQTNPLVATLGIRAVAYLLDVLPALLFGVIALIPIVGQFIAGVLLGCYWLLRDSGGRSLGKMLLGLQIVDEAGNPAQSGARITRNVPLAVPAFTLMIPIIGYFIAGPLSMIAFLVEVIMLATQGYRFGDKLAHTRVVKM